MKYAAIKNCDIANGNGVRVSLFVSGCRHHCPGCFNSEAWDFNFGKEFTEKEIEDIIEDLKPDFIQGLSLLGGEPLEIENQKGLLPLLRRVKEVYGDSKDIWCYSGFLFDDEILGKMYDNEVTKELLSYVDIIVDGKFDLNLKNPSLRFRGSSNQRVIDVKESIKQGKVEIWKELEAV